MTKPTEYGVQIPPVYKAILVEVGRGELADSGVHAVLDGQHDDSRPAILQPFEQAPLQLQVLCLLTQHRCRQLLRISDKHRPACAQRL